ncbi:hypothetical protein [Microvirga sp. 3-52]|uniref:winged helix domain-containing protein n=1 Tax=Microvirga sp. 3-52 TaxID=2792425 RepID=UPI0020BF571D|nr:hypothetical protein [Microvirga sp. 3-52]
MTIHITSTAQRKPAHNQPVVAMMFLHEGQEIQIIGREAWMLDLLKTRGDKGVTTIEVPGARMSHYVMKLRRKGLDIETADERHSGPFAGSHGRYVLRPSITVLKLLRAGEAHHAE